MIVQMNVANNKYVQIHCVYYQGWNLHTEG